MENNVVWRVEGGSNFSNSILIQKVYGMALLKDSGVNGCGSVKTKA